MYGASQNSLRHCVWLIIVFLKAWPPLICILFCCLAWANPPLLCRFFMFFLLTFLVHQWSVALFRMMGALCRNLVVANAVGMMVMLLVFLVSTACLPSEMLPCLSKRS